MAYDEALAARVREKLQSRDDVTERKMFGGLTFMVSGHMCCGVLNDVLMSRVGLAQYDKALAKTHAKEMDFTGKSMKGYVFVDSPGIRFDEYLRTWVSMCEAFVRFLPPK